MAIIRVISSCENSRKASDKREQTRTQIASWIQSVAGIDAQSGADCEHDSADEKRFKTGRSAAGLFLLFVFSELNNLLVVFVSDRSDKKQKKKSSDNFVRERLRHRNVGTRICRENARRFFGLFHVSVQNVNGAARRESADHL